MASTMYKVLLGCELRMSDMTAIKSSHSCILLEAFELLHPVSSCARHLPHPYASDRRDDLPGLISSRLLSIMLGVMNMRNNLAGKCSSFCKTLSKRSTLNSVRCTFPSADDKERCAQDDLGTMTMYNLRHRPISFGVKRVFP